MFSKSSRDSRPAPANGNGGSRRGMFSVLGPDIALTGNIKAESELHVEGRIDGDVDCGTLVQGGDSQITGNVTAETARVAGTIEGTVRAANLTVERTARITGDVEYEAITIEQGGQIDGRLKRTSTVTLAEDATIVATLATAE